MLILVMMMAVMTVVMIYKGDSSGSTGSDDVPPEDWASKVVRSLLLHITCHLFNCFHGAWYNETFMFGGGSIPQLFWHFHFKTFQYFIKIEYSFKAL